MVVALVALVVAALVEFSQKEVSHKPSSSFLCPAAPPSGGAVGVFRSTQEQVLYSPLFHVFIPAIIQPYLNLLT